MDSAFPPREPLLSIPVTCLTPTRAHQDTLACSPSGGTCLLTAGGHVNVFLFSGSLVQHKRPIKLEAVLGVRNSTKKYGKRRLADETEGGDVKDEDEDADGEPQVEETEQRDRQFYNLPMGLLVHPTDVDDQELRRLKTVVTADLKKYSDQIPAIEPLYQLTQYKDKHLKPLPDFISSQTPRSKDSITHRDLNRRQYLRPTAVKSVRWSPKRDGVERKSLLAVLMDYHQLYVYSEDCLLASDFQKLRTYPLPVRIPTERLITDEDLKENMTRLCRLAVHSYEWIDDDHDTSSGTDITGQLLVGSRDECISLWRVKWVKSCPAADGTHLKFRTPRDDLIAELIMMIPHGLPSPVFSIRKLVSDYYSLCLTDGQVLLSCWNQTDSLTGFVSRVRHIWPESDRILVQAITGHKIHDFYQFAFCKGPSVVLLSMQNLYSEAGSSIVGLSATPTNISYVSCLGYILGSECKTILLLNADKGPQMLEQIVELDVSGSLLRPASGKPHREMPLQSLATLPSPGGIFLFKAYLSLEIYNFRAPISHDIQREVYLVAYPLVKPQDCLSHLVDHVTQVAKEGSAQLSHIEISERIDCLYWSLERDPDQVNETLIQEVERRVRSLTAQSLNITQLNTRQLKIARLVLHLVNNLKILKSDDLRLAVQTRIKELDQAIYSANFRALNQKVAQNAGSAAFSAQQKESLTMIKSWTHSKTLDVSSETCGLCGMAIKAEAKEERKEDTAAIDLTGECQLGHPFRRCANSLLVLDNHLSLDQVTCIRCGKSYAAFLWREIWPSVKYCALCDVSL